jgi:hypothetical protein
MTTTPTDEDVAAGLDALAARRTNKPNGSDKQYRYQLIAFDDLQPGTKSAFLVDGTIPRRGLAAVWGPPKCGKSFWAFDLTMHIALAWPYRGRRVHGGPVAYLAFEGASGFGARAEAFRRQHLNKNNCPFAIGDEVQVEINGVFVFEKPVHIREFHEHGGETWCSVFGSDSAVPMSSLRRATPIPFFLLASNAKLVRDHKALIESIDGQIGDLPPVAVALDTLNRSIDGSENKDQDMGDYLAAAEAIVEEFDCVVIIVHHCGIEGTRPRGHSSLTGAVDAQLSVKRNEAGNVVVTVEAMKDGAEGATFTSALKVVEVGTDDDGAPLSSCVIVPVEGAVAAPARQKTTDRQKLALGALAEVILAYGRAAPANYELPPSIKLVLADLWRTELVHKNVLDAKAKNPGARFQELRNSLAARNLIGSRDEFVWLAHPPRRPGGLVFAGASAEPTTPPAEPFF